MQLTDETKDKWRQQAALETLRVEPTCDTCRHFKPAPLSRPGIYTGDDGVCGMLMIPVPRACVTVCDGYQCNIGERREKATPKPKKKHCHTLAALAELQEELGKRAPKTKVVRRLVGRLFACYEREVSDE